MVGYLVLENGEIFEGDRIGYNSDTACEVVFNTSMVGYIETLTDPSYYGQGIVMTYPLIGNYGVMPEDYESDGIFAKAVFVHEVAEFESNFRSKFNFDKFLRDYKIPGLTNVNTRKLVRVLRDSGTMKGYLTSNISNIDEIMKKIKDYHVGKAVDKVSSNQVKVYGRGKNKKVAVVDYGVEHNLINSLLKRDCEVTVFPANTTADRILAMKPDGIMLSNGPGDPADYDTQIRVVKKLYDSNIPILGIAFGHQLMGLANNFKIGKLKYGHRGPNHPVKDLKQDIVHITNQNHGYYIIGESIDKKIAEVSHVNLNDGTVEGLRYKNKKVFTIQFYPEDADYIYDEFIEMMK
ncbi:MAG: carbamoyl phosphate synthase small subunit [Clostridia bacterium]|nr:carbamoyl phosphate synthase small subunit [Clostridia bacterium]